MPEDGNRTRAAAYVDDHFQEERRNLVLMHRHQERWMLGLQKSRLQSHAQNREEAELRHAQRLRSIEERKERIADRLHQQHNSLAGRMQAMTKKGRARQAEQLERLDERAMQLQGRAQRSFAALQERQFQAQQRDRIQSAREVKFLRLDHLEARRTHTDHHNRTRDIKIEVREQQLRDAQRKEREQTLKREMQQNERERAAPCPDDAARPDFKAREGG